MGKFDIETYLNSLLDDVDIIDVSNKNLDYLPDLLRFKKLKELHCDYNNLTSLPILPKKLKELYCGFNKLSLLPVLPENLIVLGCSHNKLTSLPVLPKNLKRLFFHNNKLTSLPVLSEKLELLYCDNNKLTSLPVLPEKLKYSCFFGNPICDIIYDYDLNIIKKNIIIWNNFRYLYYCLKYRKRFLRMMEPIIKKRYHPSHLYDLKEDDDLDEKLGAL